jgi:hypothetical protein
MNPIFKQISELYQAGFRQQSEATCGPASIILASQGLGLCMHSESQWIDERFAKWVPVEKFLIRGMALHELQFVSELIFGQQVEIKIRRAYPENFSLFQQDIKDSFRTMNTVIVANFRQDDFMNTTACELGNPHYSPIISCDKHSHKVMVADVDSLVLEPYWVAIDALFHSMSHCNPTLNIPRGWLVLRARGGEKP